MEVRRLLGFRIRTVADRKAIEGKLTTLPNKIFLEANNAHL